MGEVKLDLYEIICAIDILDMLHECQVRAGVNETNL